MQLNVHNLILIYIIFIHMQWNAVFIHCLLFFLSVLMYIIIFTMYAYICPLCPSIKPFFLILIVIHSFFVPVTL